MVILTIIIFVILFCICVYERHERQKQQEAAERLKETIRDLQEKNKRLFDSLIQTEKTLSKTELRASGYERTIIDLKRELEVKSQLLKQLDRGNGND